MKQKILILGKNGMLGSMVYDYLVKQSDFEVDGTTREQFDADKFLIDPTHYAFLLEYDYIINCIGVIKPFCKDDDPKGVVNAIKINALFPHKLLEFCKDSKVKIIQIATDCVFSGKDGNYNEDSPHDPLDVYGKTKSLGEVFIGDFLNIRCSIIGPENEKKVNLLEWFLSQKNGGSITGFSHHKWNGVTTLQFAKLCLKIIEEDKFDEILKLSHTHHFDPNEAVTKFELLKLFAKVFNKKIKIIPTDTPTPSIDRTLSTKYNILSLLFGGSTLESALEELKDYMGRIKND